MKATLIYGKGDVRFEERQDPRIVSPTDAYYQDIGHLRLRLGSLELPRDQQDHQAKHDGP